MRLITDSDVKVVLDNHLSFIPQIVWDGFISSDPYMERTATINLDGNVFNPGPGSHRVVSHVARYKGGYACKYAPSIPGAKVRVHPTLIFSDESGETTEIFTPANTISNYRTAGIGVAALALANNNPKSVLIIGRGPSGQAMKAMLEAYFTGIRVEMVGKSTPMLEAYYDAIIVLITEATLIPPWLASALFLYTPLIIEFSRHSIMLDSNIDYQVIVDTVNQLSDPSHGVLKWGIKDNIHILQSSYKNIDFSRNTYIKFAGSIFWDIALAKYYLKVV